MKDGKSGAVGTGIGLAFSKSLAEAHHGTLSLEDSVYGGSSFVLTLPWGEEAVSEEPEVVIPDGREAADEEQVPSYRAVNLPFCWWKIMSTC